MIRDRLLATLGRLRRVIERVGRVMNDTAGWVFVGCALFVSFDVLARKLFGVSSRATVELTGYMLAFGIAWGLADALTARAHIRVDLVVPRLPLAVRAWMHALALAFLAVLSSVFAWRAWAVVRESWEFGARDSSALAVPLVVPQALWAIGITALAVLAALMLCEVALLLALHRRADVDARLGPRTVQEEAGEALEAAGATRQEGARA